MAGLKNDIFICKSKMTKPGTQVLVEAKTKRKIISPSVVLLF